MSDNYPLLEQLNEIESEITPNSHLHYDKYYELLAKLHILLVKNRMKKAYFESVSLKKRECFEGCTDVESIIIDHLKEEGGEKLSSLNTLKKIALKLKLHTHESNHSYFYLNKNDVVPDNILERFSKTFGYGKYMWIYNDENVKSSIIQTIQGNIHIGELLGYPKCCVKWLTETQTQSLIDCYYFCLNKHPVILSDNAIIEFVQDYFESEIIPDNEKRVIEIIKKHVVKTIQKYPFVFHQACDRCLESSESPTAKLNQTYGKFSKQVSEKFYHEVLDESKNTVKTYEENIED